MHLRKSLACLPAAKCDRDGCLSDLTENFPRVSSGPSYFVARKCQKMPLIRFSKAIAAFRITSSDISSMKSKRQKCEICTFFLHAFVGKCASTLIHEKDLIVA